MKNKKNLTKGCLSGLLALTIAFGPLTLNSLACTSVLVGKNASVDGSTMISRNEDYSTAWSKHLIIHPRTENKEAAVFKSNGNKFIYTLPKISYKYTATPEWDESEGQMEEAGINEFQVGVSATESADPNEKAIAADPLNEDTGITEAAITSVILPSVKTAREGVELLGKIVETSGAGEGFGVSIADVNEVWYLEAGSGHHWVATRIPDDSYMIAANQLRIGKIDLKDTKNYMGSSDIIDFSTKKGLYNPKKDGEFNFAKAYGTDTAEDKHYNYPRVWWGEKMLTPSANLKYGRTDYPLFMKPDKKVSLTNVMSVLRSHYDGTQYDAYKPGQDVKKAPRPINVTRTVESHVLQLRGNLPNEIGGVHWIAMGVPETSVYIPFYSGITDTPKQYKLGTNKCDNESAYWAFRSVSALATANDKTSTESLKYVKSEWKVFEDDLFSQQKSIDENALKLYNTSRFDCAKYLTDYASTTSESAITKAHNMQNELITKLTKVLPEFKGL